MNTAPVGGSWAADVDSSWHFSAASTLYRLDSEQSFSRQIPTWPHMLFGAWVVVNRADWTPIGAATY